MWTECASLCTYQKSESQFIIPDLWKSFVIPSHSKFQACGDRIFFLLHASDKCVVAFIFILSTEAYSHVDFQFPCIPARPILRLYIYASLPVNIVDVVFCLQSNQTQKKFYVRLHFSCLFCSNIITVSFLNLNGMWICRQIKQTLRWNSFRRQDLVVFLRAHTSSFPNHVLHGCIWSIEGEG